MDSFYEKISVVAAIIMFMTALVFKLDDREGQFKSLHRYIFLLSLAIMFITPNMEVQHVNSGIFTTIALYALGVWFILELLNLITTLIPTISTLKETLLNSKDLKRSLDKTTMLVEDQIDNYIKDLNDLSKSVHAEKKANMNQLITDIKASNRLSKNVINVIINTYSNLIEFDVNNQITADLKNQLKNIGLSIIDDNNVPFDSKVHILSSDCVITNDINLDRLVAKTVRVGIQDMNGEVLEAATVVRYKYSDH